jgi:Na+-translocating ferredoxin:NAD+ oxidoreductase RnfC subunit
LLAALHEGDVDRALTRGLLRCNGCGDCSRACGAGIAVAETLVAARDERLRALAARERYRARTLRLERRAAERAAKRAPASKASAVPGGPATVADNRPPLPSAAAAVLARAKARAAERGKP